MIEPHSAQLGASSWILNATFVAPRDRVTVPEPLPFPVLAWPFDATTASSSRAGEEDPLATLAVAADVVTPIADASVFTAVSTATDARGLFSSSASVPVAPPPVGGR